MIKRRQYSPALWASMLVLSLFMLPAQARDLPDYYPPTFQWMGTLNGLDLGKNLIVIRDVVFPLADEVAVYTPRSRFATLRSLRKGMKLGCKVDVNEKGTEVISAIWIFPPSAGPMLPPPPGH